MRLPLGRVERACCNAAVNAVRIWVGAAVAAVPCFVGLPVAAQQVPSSQLELLLDGSASSDSTDRRELPLRCYPNLLDVRVKREAVESFAEEPWAGAVTGSDDVPVEPMFGGIAMADLDRLYAGVVANGDPSRVAHLSCWFSVTARDVKHSGRLLEALREDPRVEYASRRPIPILASIGGLPGGGGGGGTCRSVAGGVVRTDLPPMTPDLTAEQDAFFGPAPMGNGVRLAHRFLGARGNDVGVYHVELGWFFDHEDIPISTANVLGNASAGTPFDVAHGSGVIGLIVAPHNGYGMDGFADLCEPTVVFWNQNGGLVQSLLLVALDACPGDVVLMVIQFALGQVGFPDFVPAEYYQAIFDAISTLSSNGLICVTAAGNGRNDLDDPRFTGRFDLSVRDSGAIMVGGSDGLALRPASFTNFGSRVDAAGFGEFVPVPGAGVNLFYPGRDDRQRYTNQGGGTSAATGNIGGVVTSLQGVAKTQLGRTLTSLELRALIRDHGVPIPALGSRPDMMAAMNALGVVDGLEIDARRVPVGTPVDITMRGAAGEVLLLLGGLFPASLDLGFGRPLLINPIGLSTFGVFPIGGSGVATTILPIPNDPALDLLTIPLQCARINLNGDVFLTNACEFQIVR